MRRGGQIWSWFWMVLGVLYFFLPLLATFLFSLRAERGVLSFLAYERVLTDPDFTHAFGYSAIWAVFTIIVSVLIFVPTAFLIRLKLPQFRTPVEFITLLPFVVPVIVYTFSLIRTFSQPPLLIVDTPMLLIFAYTVISMPYMYSAVDTGLRAIDVRTLSEAGQSLGAGWSTILFRIILPNIRVAILSGAFITFDIVMGELILAQYLVKPAFAPYMAFLMQQKAYEPAALAIISFALTWASMGIIQLVGRGRGQEAQIAAGH